MDQEAALEGAREMDRFLAYISGAFPNLSAEVNSDARLHFVLYALFTGLTPINRLKDGARELKLQFNEAFKLFGTQRVEMIDIPECAKVERIRSEFININAVRKVVEMNRRYFPDFTDPIEWIRQNPQVLCYECTEPGDMKHVTYGILSGFPPQACRDYRVFTESLSFLNEAGITLPSFVSNPQHLRDVFARSEVADSLSGQPSHLRVLQNARASGFLHFTCYTFSEEQAEYVRYLEEAFFSTLMLVGYNEY
ncbi:hypothetical protein C4561_05185 [candidate division WWE3 bacterium]|uniref:Uncharacterized protein n=1 Tax=candidate division WWE3 bacterium TaxID=2053526 RepID=A0A3A4ZB79_UNCKA|nr:MAG: hypothetical protein C4561_05185 [candidate division WWE3 bacterium]